MRSYGISFKLWAAIIAMTMALLVFILIFQTEFLNDFYYEMEIEQLEKDCIRLSNYVAKGQYDFTIPYYSVMRRVNDIIIVTDREGIITYVEGTNQYNLGHRFGLMHIEKILNGEIVHEKGKMIRNPYSVWPKEMDTLLVGVPVRKTMNIAQKNRQSLSESYGGETLKRPEISEAVYIITTLEYMQTTIDAIKKQFAYIFIIAIALASAISFFLSQGFSKPLKLINNAAMEISKGNYDAKINLRSSREIKELGDTINNLAKQLTRVEQIRREFIANVSHEIRTPLSYLQGYSEVLQDGLVESEEDRKKYLGIIMDETVRLKKMVDEILQLSQIEAGFAKLQSVPFSMDVMIRITIDKLLPHALKRNITIEYVNISGDALVCYADEDKTKQVLINLINNATKHSLDYGNILISAYRQGHNINVCVRDFGEGIAEVDLPFIWDRFYIIDKKKSENSTGLGLAIVKDIINAHGCEINVKSAKGEGTEFCFYLPAYSENMRIGEE
ncbi:MAG TPA: histidine kinase dimerization/phospho-acceptor domain-containing protein [Bacillota bacterium]|nr:histidine kinase dimerization/phospho-acceptor domain-containing protein [Bacillota bacterium]